MKINRLETHDRLLHFQKQADQITQGCLDCIKNRPEEFGNLPFYIFAHKREIGIDEKVAIFNQDWQCNILNPKYKRSYLTIEDVPTHRMIWEPRLTKPSAQTNSMLFKAYPPGDTIKTIWILPERELWEQYSKDNMTESEIVLYSIHNFVNNKSKLESTEDDDLSDDQINHIYMQISQNARNKKMMSKLYVQ